MLPEFSNSIRPMFNLRKSFSIPFAIVTNSGTLRAKGITAAFTGASASIRVNYVDGSTIRFTKQGDYDNKILTDTVEIKLDGERFTGINTIKLETLSDIDKSIIKTETAKYSLAGEKISGMSIMEK